MRILIVKLSAIGDCVLTLPVLHRLRQAHPEAHIAWLVEDRCHAILEGHPELDRQIVVQRRACAGLRDRFEMATRLVQQLEGESFDLSLDFQGLFKSAWAPRMARIPRRVGYEGAREGARLLYTERHDLPTPDQHAADRYLSLMAAAFGEPAPAKATREDFLLPVDDAAEQAVDGFIEGPFAVLNVSAGKQANRWMTDRFAALADGLAEAYGWTIVLSGGPADAERAARVEAAVRTARTRVACGRFDLKGLVALLRRAALLVSGDSGPMHIANALGTRLVALFGSSDPARTGPYLEGRTRLLRHPVDCAPCFKKSCPNPPQTQLVCLEQIEVEEVLAAVATLI